MNYQTELDKKLVRHFLDTEDVFSREELKNFFNKDKNEEYNKTRENYFHLSYNALIYLNLIDEEGYLHSKYESIYDKKSEVEFIFNIVIDTIQRYRLRLFQALEIQKGSDGEWLAEDEEVRRTRREITDVESKELLDDISTVIHDLLNRFINDSKIKPLTTYQLRTHSSFAKEKSMNVLLFKKLLFFILKYNKEIIYKSDIKSIHDEMIDTLGWEQSKSAKSNMKKHIVDVLVLLKIFENNKPPYKVVEIIEPEWKMNVLTKIDAIRDIVKSIANRKQISKEDRQSVMKIFNFQN